MDNPNLPREAYVTISKFFDQLVYYREAYDHHHGHDTSDMATQLAEAINLDPVEITLIKVAAHLHDLGKLTIDQSVVNKPGRLLPVEFGIIKLHTIFGHSIASAMSLGPIIEDAILHHHEHHDGSGYPHGLSGSQTSIHTQIIHIADAWDALTHDRPYRKAYPAREAIAVLENESHKFDPHLLSILRRKVTNWTTTLSR